MLYKQIMSKYYSDGKPEDAFNIYGMATAYSMVDVLKKACGHEFTQPPRDDRLAGLGARDEVVEPRRAVEGLAQDEHRRLRADDIERPGHGAPVGPPGVAGLEAAGQVDRGIHRPQCT